MNFHDLEAHYEEAELTSPIKQCKEGEGRLYTYRFFPKLMDKLMISEEALLKIDWPCYKFEIPEPPPSRDLFNPKEGYTKDNINIMLWIICCISTYWYPFHTEKIVHVTELVHYLLKVMTKLHKTHRKAIVKYTIESIRMFGDYRTIAENMSYFIQNVDIYSKYKIDWVSLNKLAIAYKYLDLGKPYDYEAIGNKNSQAYDDKPCYDESDFIEITEKESADLFDNHAKLDKQKRLGSIVGNENEIKLQSPRAYTLHRNKGNFTMVEKLRIMHDNPMYEETVEKLIKHNSANRINDVVQSPLNVFVERKKTTHVQNHPETFGDLTPENGCDVEFFEEEETIEISKRTLNLEATKDEYQYFVIPTSQCHSCHKRLEGRELKEHIILKSKS